MDNQQQQQQQDFDQFFDFSQAVSHADDQAHVPFSPAELSPMPCPVHSDLLTCDCANLAPEYMGLPDDLDSFMQDLDPTTFDLNPALTEADFGSMSFNSEIPVGTCADNFGSLTQTHTTPSAEGTEPSTANTTHINSPFTQSYSPYDLPGIKRPDQPCDYCRSKRLECFVTFVGSEPGVKEKSCNACKVLFRPCSFVPRPNAGPDSTVRGYMDTLSQIHEDSALQWGEMTGVKPLITLGATYHDVVNDRAERRPDKALSRFSRVTVQILRDWLDAHADHPYPTEEEKDQLRDRTGLQRTQISNWLANARRRGKVKMSRSASAPENVNNSLPSAPVNIPGSNKAVEDMSPFERWRHSPPENEPARHSDIAYALATTKMNETEPASGQQSKSNSVTGEQRSTDGSFSQYRVGKASSTTTSLESLRSWQSGSQGSKESGDSRSSYNSFARRHQRRRRRRSGTPLTTHSKQTPTSPAPTPNATASSTNAVAATKKAKRPFNCTFCTDTFNSKYDWARHEKSLHLSLERWTCCPNGPVEQHSTPASTGGQTLKPVCAYCLNADPTPEHINTHNHQSSFDHSEALRTFYRKDHLRQHLRLVHSVPLQPHMEKWKSALDNIRSRCGFCQDVWFTSWSERADHLAKHFRAGMTMDSWKGDWGFDAEIQKLVCNAIAPFLLASEAKTPSPFSATSPGTMRCGTLIKEISEWALTLQNQGTEITDDMIKRKARVVLYDDEDGWNQTPADNPEWLAWCKKTFQIGLQEAFTDPANNWGAQVSSGVPREPWDFGDFATRQQLSDIAAYTQGQNPLTQLVTAGEDVEMEGIMGGLDLGAGGTQQDEIFSMDINDMNL